MLDTEDCDGTQEISRKSWDESLIGVHGSLPHSWGNYFWLADGPRISNFWAENLNAAKEEFLFDGLVEVVEWKFDVSVGGDGKWPSEPAHIAIIHDERIPASWYYNKLCFTGGFRPPLNIAKEMFEVLGGDPTDELEQWTDPKSYYAKRGGEWHESGLVTYRLS